MMTAHLKIQKRRQVFCPFFIGIPAYSVNRSDTLQLFKNSLAIYISAMKDRINIL